MYCVPVHNTPSCVNTRRSYRNTIQVCSLLTEYTQEGVGYKFVVYLYCVTGTQYKFVPTPSVIQEGVTAKYNSE